ncbi:MAG TPA: DUF6600 domain-containing protein [Bryobacteraceae bacterium]|nr:DUF6600 domain-containing protein [Bryobacteraceae bacterium]
MLREFLAMLMALSVTFFAIDPAATAQYGSPSGAYPQASQQGAPQYPNQPGNYPPNSYGGADPSQGAGAPDPQQEAAGDQQHGIARTSIVQGDVNVQRGESGPLTSAVVNAPLATGDRLQTSDGSRAEVELDYANLVRLAPDTELVFADLENRRYQLQLGAGTVIFRVLRNLDAQAEVDTPSVGFRPLGQGEFRISVLNDGTTQITARVGQGELFGPRGSQQLPAGQTVLIRGDANDPESKNIDMLARDQFDDWSAQRDSELLSSRSYNYVSPNAYGADDLDRYGNWVPSQYGQVWTPQSEPEGWSPYSTGQWTWQDYYGWTWVDSAPWGWAPYHYGRWFVNGNYGWCWWPGGLHASFGWSPALVGFFGWGGFGLGVALGGLGWVALAPFELFHRWWGPGWYGRGWGAYGRGGFRPYANFARNVDIAHMYRNAAFRGGAMTAGYNGFGGPHQHFSAASRTQLAGANAFRGGQLPLTPNRSSLQFSNRSVASNPRLAQSANSHFFSSPQFNRSSAYRGQGGAGFGANVGANRSQHGVAPNMQQGFSAHSGSAGAPNRSSGGGWQRFGDPGNSGALRQGFNSSASERSGWHSFGQPQRSPGSSYSFGSRQSAPAYSSPRYSAPSYNTPGRGAGNYSSPHFSNPGSNSFSRPRNESPRQGSTPHASAPHSSSGGGHSGGGGSGGGGHSGGSHGGGGGHHR